MLDSIFFHECSVATSKLDPNYNQVYKFYFIILLSITTLSVCYTLCTFYVNIRMIEIFIVILYILCVCVCECVYVCVLC